MTKPRKTSSSPRFSIQSLIVLTAFVALGFVIFKQYRQNRDARLEVQQLRVEIQALEAKSELLSEKLSYLAKLKIDESNESARLSVNDVSNLTSGAKE